MVFNIIHYRFQRSAVSFRILRLSVSILILFICVLPMQKANADVLDSLIDYGGKKLIDKALDGDEKNGQSAQNSRNVSMSTQQIQTSIKSAIVLSGYKKSELLTEAYADFETAYTVKARERAIRFFIDNSSIKNVSQIQALIEKMHASVQSIGLTGGQMVKFQEYTIFLHEAGQASFLPNISNVQVHIIPQKKYLAMVISGKATKFKRGKINANVLILNDKGQPLVAAKDFDTEGHLGKEFKIQTSGKEFKINQKFGMPLSLISNTPKITRQFTAKITLTNQENAIFLEKTSDDFYIYKDELTLTVPWDKIQADNNESENVNNVNHENRKNRLTVNLWGGYNITSKPAYVKNGEAINESVTTFYNKANNTSLEGFATGGEIMYGANALFGLSVGYYHGHRSERTFTDASNNKYSLKSQADFVIISAAVKYYLVSGLHIGAGIGFATVSDGMETFSINGQIPFSYAGKSVPLFHSGTGLAFQGKLGYDFTLSEYLLFGLNCGFTYLSLTLDDTLSTSSGTPVYNTWFITPSASITLRL